MTTPHNKAWQLSSLDEQVLQLALQEDLSTPFCDVTTETLLGERCLQAEAYIVSKHPEPFILCGTMLAKALLQRLPDPCEINCLFQDRDRVTPGATVFQLRGSLKTLLMAERTLLNFLQHLSGIATTTRAFVDAVKHTALKILDTRKTTPGLRHLAKYAVACGGGVNHRFALYDVILIKDNHIDALGGTEKTLQALPEQKQFPTLIEVRTLQELDIVLKKGLHKIDRVLLDNMNLSELRASVDCCKGKIATETSGNITLASIVPLAETGVDYASIGALTHSFDHIDLSMRIT